MLTRHIIFANRANWLAIGGVENSLRAMATCLVPGEEGHIVCRVENDDVLAQLPLKPEGVELTIHTYSEATGPSRELLRTLKLLRKAYPRARVIARHHLSALYAANLGFDVAYLVPSIIRYQAVQEYGHLGVVARIKLFVSRLFHDFWQRRALARVKQVFVFSTTMKAQIARIVRLPNEPFIVKPGIDPLRFRFMASCDGELRRQNTTPEDAVVLLFVGRLVAAKGLDRAISALQDLPEHFVLWIVGSGAQSHELEALATRLGVLDRVRFLGPRSDVERYYQAANVFLMTSRYEPLGQTILEAAASGLPVVAFRPDQHVDTATAELDLADGVFWCAYDNSAGLPRAILEAATYRKGSELSAHVHRRYSWRSLLDTLLDS
jgi:glycosyltransferase involved in cell wall biosynthesis